MQAEVYRKFEKDATPHTNNTPKKPKIGDHVLTMIGLILETSTEKGCIALVKGPQILAATHIAGGPALSHQLASSVETLLKKTHSPLQFVAAGTGPGSYTGIRVGAALAKALSFGKKIPILGFCNLLSFQIPNDPHSAVLFDARSGGFYYLKDAHSKACLISLTESEEILSPHLKIASPHPELIIKRLPFLEGKLIETSS